MKSPQEVKLTARFESELIPEIAENYEERFRSIYSQYHNPMIEFFLHRGLSLEEAEDLAQETFLRIYKGLGAFRREASLDTWMYRIARNVYANTLRDRRSLRRSVEPSDIQLKEIAAEASGLHELDPLDDTLQHERSRLLREAISALPPRMREVLLLRLTGFGYEEITRATRLSSQTVKATLHQARRRIRERLTEYFDELAL